MAKRKHTAEQVIKQRLQAEVATAEGRTVAEAFRKTGITEQTFLPLAPQFWTRPVNPASLRAVGRPTSCIRS